MKWRAAKCGDFNILGDYYSLHLCTTIKHLNFAGKLYNVIMLHKYLYKCDEYTKYIPMYYLKKVFHK